MQLRQITKQTLDIAEAVPYSAIALLARVSAGGVFWRSGQTKIDGFGLKESTLFLFEEEYQLPWIAPEIAAYVTAVSENLFSMLLIAGLASRLSAAALLVLTCVIQIFVHPSAWPDHALWATALLIVLARGPGILSCDHLLVRYAAPLAIRPATGA
jgi:putative oxidoreductase